MRLSFASQREDDALIEAVEFLKAALDKGKSLSRYRFEEIPKAFIPQGLKPYIHDDDENGQKRIQADKYEFLVCRLLRNHLESGTFTSAIPCASAVSKRISFRNKPGGTTKTRS